MRYRLSFHAQEEMVIRDVSPATLDDVLTNPGQVLEQGPTKQVTLYKTTQVDRYWKS